MMYKYVREYWFGYGESEKKNFYTFEDAFFFELETWGPHGDKFWREEGSEYFNRQVIDSTFKREVIVPVREKRELA